MNKGKIEYRAMQLRYCVRRFAYKAGKQEYLPKSALNRDDFNTVISNLILSGKPIMVGRFGSQEARATAWALGVAKGYDKAIPLYVQKRMAVGPGFSRQTTNISGASVFSWPNRQPIWMPWPIGTHSCSNGF